jgi:hypothetical protein
VVITGINNMEILELACEAVWTFHPMNDEDVRSLLSKTATAAVRGEFEPFKTTFINIRRYRPEPGVAGRRAAPPAAVDAEVRRGREVRRRTGLPCEKHLFCC